jgi:hypothetical protein
VPASVDYRQSARRFGVLLWANLGSCSCCIHSAFRAAFIAWVLASSGLAIPIASPILTCIVGIACAFTVLWSVHLLAHALKVSIAARKQQWTSGNQAGISRRKMMPIFAKAVLSAAVVASVPTFAFGQCNEAAAARCQAAASDCRAHCNRIFPRAGGESRLLSGMLRKSCCVQNRCRMLIAVIPPRAGKSNSSTNQRNVSTLQRRSATSYGRIETFSQVIQEERF